MNQPKKILSIIFVAAVVVFGGRISFAQGESKSARETSYEAMLYVVLGSDEAAQGAELPKSLLPVTKQIRDNFVFGNYRLLNTYVGRVANNGSLEYKSVSSLPGPERELDSPSFLEWQLNGLRSSDSAVGNDLLLMQMFRFGARVPIKITATENGKTNQAINYESVGLNVSRLSVASNSPTLIGTITLPRTAGTVFLVLAVRPV
ncbi:MAG: hypothetical protein KIT61_04680 [Pyrinomonadaceae bacterium]|nr:hypothetical protein [Blastocatellia bacterium]MCW5955856.1 hypothetical protein [Pyrinomonadaceae bacterium]